MCVKVIYRSLHGRKTNFYTVCGIKVLWVPNYTGHFEVAQGTGASFIFVVEFYLTSWDLLSF